MTSLIKQWWIAIMMTMHKVRTIGHRIQIKMDLNTIIKSINYLTCSYLKIQMVRKALIVSVAFELKKIGQFANKWLYL